MIRKKIYALLFSKPIYDYAKLSNNQNCINILIASNDIDDCTAFEAFKAVYWCSQMTDEYQISIHIACANPNAQKAKFLTDMPALKENLIPVDLLFIGLEEISIKSADYDYNYIILSPDINPEDVVDYIATAKQGFNKRLLCVFNNDIPLGTKDNIEIINIADDSMLEEDFSKLEQYAYNCNFAYNMGIDERCKKVKLEDFQKSDEYNYYSSLSFCVHIPYKLHLCEGFALKGQDAIDVLNESIRLRDSLYYQMLDIEHRRWMAYMITEGWRMPTDDELLKYAYTDYGFGGNDHRYKDKKLHPCICKGSKYGFSLLEHNELWAKTSQAGITTLAEMKDYLKNNYKKTDFSELEAISLVLHNIASKIAYKANENIDRMFEFTKSLPQKSNLTIYNRLQQSAHKLKRREENAITLFENTLKQAKAVAVTDNCLSDIEFIEKSLQIVIERNRRRNFAVVDGVMVDMIPFCLWYGKDNKTIITFCSDVHTDDVIIPTLLSAENAVFISQGFTNKYRQNIKKYFQKRNQGTKTYFRTCNTENRADIFETLDYFCDKYEGVSISCLNNSILTTMAVGAYAEENQLPVFAYSLSDGLTNISNGKKTWFSLTKKNFTVDEYIGLLGGEYSNMYNSTLYFRELDSLEDLFVKYSYEHLIKSDGKEKKYSTWSALSNFFQAASANKTFNIIGKFRKESYEGTFEPEVFDNCKIDAFLLKLQEYSIITDYEKKIEECCASVKFTYYDSNLVKLISKYEHQRTINQKDKKISLQKRLSFSTTQDEAIGYMDLQVKRAQLCNKDENPTIKKLKIDFINELVDKNIIHTVSFSDDKDYVSLIFSNFSVQSLFKNQGKLFELLLYYKLKSSGYFNDVQTGVKVLWTNKTRSLEELIVNYINESRKHGYNNYCKAYKEARNQLFNLQNDIGISNEIDIILTIGMMPVFISCKTSKTIGKEELYEISSIAEHFHAKPVLAVTKDLNKDTNNLLLLRAKQMGVSLIGFETIFDENRLDLAMKQLSEGNTIFGTETNIHF